MHPGSLAIDAQRFRRAFVHPFRSQGRRFLLVVADSSIVALDPVSEAIIEALAGGPLSPEEIGARLPLDLPPAALQNALAELQEFGAVERESAQAAASATSPFSPAGRAARALEESRARELRTLVLNIAQVCNLACLYCYADEGTYRSKGLMGEEVARRAVEHMLAQAGESRDLSVTLFGGEPLMNWPLVEFVVGYATGRAVAEGRRIGFSMTTNATLLRPAHVDFFNRHGIRVMVSIDGPPAVHDANRPAQGGGASFERVAAGVRLMRERYRVGPLVARATVTRLGTDVRSYFPFLKSMGFDQAGFSPASSKDPRLALGPAGLAEVFDGLMAIGRDHLAAIRRHGAGLGFSNLENVLRMVHEGHSKDYACGAALGMVGVGAQGTLYPCHRFVGVPGFEIGSVQEGFSPARERFLDEVRVDRKQPCRTCFAQRFCGGSCHYENWLATGDHRTPPEEHCDAVRRWIAFGLEAYCELALQRPEYLEGRCGSAAATTEPMDGELL